MEDTFMESLMSVADVLLSIEEDMNQNGADIEISIEMDDGSERSFIFTLKEK